MAKLTADIVGVAAGEIYPRTFAAGEDCPESLLGYAASIGAVDKAAAKAPSAKAHVKVPETK